MAGLDISTLKNQRMHRASQKKASGTTSLLKGSQFSDKQKLQLYLEAASMLNAGLDLRETLEFLVEEQKGSKARQALKVLMDQVIEGKSLWQAMEESQQFTPYEYYTIQIGEETGQMAEVLMQLHAFFKSKLKLRRQLMNALSYPAVVMLTSIGAVGFMLIFVVPMFSDIFRRFNGELPYLTQVIVSASTQLKDNSYLLLCVVVILICMGIYASRSSFGKRWGAIAILRVPIVGPLVRSVYLARFCGAMGLLISAQVPLLRTIALTRQMINFYPITTPLNAIEQKILQGQSLHTCLSEVPIFDHRMVALVKIGEEVNQLGGFFTKLSEQYTDDFEHRTSLLQTFLEPFLIILLGSVVGFILIAMYLPMFELSTSFGN